MPGNNQPTTPLYQLSVPISASDPVAGVELLTLDVNGQFQINSATGQDYVMQIDSLGNVLFQSSGAVPLLTINQATPSIDIQTGLVLRVGGVQVLTGQQPAVANSTATAASVSAQLNLLLAALRAHGLIAP